MTTKQRITASLLLGLATLTGCMQTQTQTDPSPAPITCRLETEFTGWSRDPGPRPWDYPAICDGVSYVLAYQDGTACGASAIGDLVILTSTAAVSTSSGRRIWSCQPVAAASAGGEA